MSLAEEVPAAWRSVVGELFTSEWFTALDGKVSTAPTVLPPRELIFAALNATTPADVKVVVLGQDPYPTPGHANGLAFSVSQGVKVPASLRNIFIGLVEDTGVAKPVHGDLSCWARQGVLLLNTVLTVEPGKANAHKKWGWQHFTTHIVSRLASRPERTVFLCLGNQARDIVRPLAGTQPVLELAHPSPLAGPAFVNQARAMKPFTKINELLVEAGRTPIDWRVP